MKRSRWDSKTNSKIVLEVLSGRPNQSQRYATIMEYIRTNTTPCAISF
jgi:hypothetical protein